eukprot:4493296-Heterocapsa_arctica.AAC.1
MMGELLMNPADRMIEDAGVPIREQRRQTHPASPPSQSDNNRPPSNEGHGTPAQPTPGHPRSYGP